jgi:hypothetical protein
MHDIVPTQERLHRINMAATNLCKYFHTVDNLRHRLVEWREGQWMWIWTGERLATVLQIDLRSIQDAWLLRSALYIRPPKRRWEVLWTLANFVVCILQQKHKPTQHDYYDFLMRAKWKLQMGNGGRRMWVLTSALSQIISAHRAKGCHPQRIGQEVEEQ